jgi:catechol 2,3-dioxygenase-like lactoylglutathione lyase family enzyme
VSVIVNLIGMAVRATTAERGEAPQLQRIYETVLYAGDIAAVREFYAQVLGLDSGPTPDDSFAAFGLPGGAVLLIFDPAQSATPGRDVPSHGASGDGHLAFSVGEEGLDPWRRRLAEHGIELEREITWPTGAVSIYCRDPAGNSVELVDGQIWATDRAA